jgi:serine-type D-Ala-D-Ala carboxypeptidase/endopeptidase (penicillin-binding protein 4)
MLITRRSLVVLQLVVLTGALCPGPAPVWANPNPQATDFSAQSQADARSAAETLRQWVAHRRGQISLYVASARHGQQVVAINGDRPLNPASNSKILTMAAALRELGPQWRFNTKISGKARGDNVERLVIWSDGDPTLDRPLMMDWAFQVIRLGLHNFQKVVVDQSAFDDRYVPPAFQQQPNEWAAFRAPVSAVAFERNTIAISVVPKTTGTVPAVTAFPPSFVMLLSKVQTAASGEKPGALQVVASSEPIGVSYKIRGSVAAGSAPTVLVRRVEDPRLLPGYALADCLRALGANVGAVVEVGASNDEPVLVQHKSPELLSLLATLGKESDNFTAEMLVKALGAHATSRPGSTEAGMDVIRRFAERIHPLAPGTQLVNGSGLFDANRLSAELLVAVLRHVCSDPRLGPEFLASLAVAGRDGTLRNRLANEVTSSVVRAKTGTLKDVVSLSGTIDGLQPTEPWVFSVIVNGIEAPNAVKQQIDEFVTKLAAAMHTSPTLETK